MSTLEKLKQLIEQWEGEAKALEKHNFPQFTSLSLFYRDIRTAKKILEIVSKEDSEQSK